VTSRDVSSFESMILLFGSGRSGTTFLAKLLDSSPRIFYRHEPDAKIIDPRIPYLPKTDEYDNLKKICREFVSLLLNQNDARSVGGVPLFNKEYRSALENVLYRLSFFIAKGASRIGLDMAVPIYVRSTQRPTALIKSVNSVCRAPVIASALPDARILHLVRHPGAIAASRLRGAKEGKMQTNVYLESVCGMPESSLYPYTLSELESRSFAQQTAYTWMVTNDKVYRELKGNKNYRLIVYEDMCRNFRERSNEIFDFAGVPLSRQSTGFMNKLMSGGGNNSEYFSVVRNVSDNIDKWVDFYSQGEVQKINEIILNSEVGRCVLQNYGEQASGCQ